MNSMVSLGIRWNWQQFDVQLKPFDWFFRRIAGVNMMHGEWTAIAIGPVWLMRTLHDRQKRYNGLALNFGLASENWYYEFRIVPLFWCIRWKSNFMSIGPLKFIRSSILSHTYEVS